MSDVLEVYASPYSPYSPDILKNLPGSPRILYLDIIFYQPLLGPLPQAMNVGRDSVSRATYIRSNQPLCHLVLLTGSIAGGIVERVVRPILFALHIHHLQTSSYTSWLFTSMNRLLLENLYYYIPRYTSLYTHSVNQISLIVYCLSSLKTVCWPVWFVTTATHPPLHCL